MLDASSGARPIRRSAFDLEIELTSLSLDTTADLQATRKGFLKAAKSYGDRKGITYRTWRAMGVDAATLKEAGIAR